MIFYCFVSFVSALLLGGVPPANAQVDPLIPDPFRQVEESVRTKTSAQAVSLSEGETITDAPLPSYLSLTDDLSRFGRFADGGSDSNWYIGFNNAWIVRLPSRPPGKFVKAFIGAKIGRAKTTPNKQRPWEHTVIAGKVYMAVAQRPAFGSENSFFLAETSDIPLEVDDSIYRPGTGRAQWFWAEVPMELISDTENNYLIVWSPTRAFRDSKHAPILAAAEASGGAPEIGAWNNHSILGVPPRSENSALETPVGFKPALAVRLVPENEETVTVTAFEALSGENELLCRFSAIGRDIEQAWIEMSPDELEWSRVSTFGRHSPFSLRVPRSLIGPRGSYLRAVARDAYGNEGSSATLFVLGDPSR